MIPRINKSFINSAKYTMLFKDYALNCYHNSNNINKINSTCNAFISSVNEEIDPSEFIPLDSLYIELISKYSYYEISLMPSDMTEEYDDFFMLWLSRYKEIGYKYHELLVAYYKNLPRKVKDMLSRTTSRKDTSSNNTNASSSTDSTNNSTDYELPHTQTTSTDGFATSKQKSTDEVDTTNNVSHESEYDSGIIVTDNRDYMTIRKKVMDSIRDIIHEMVDEFYDCFLHVF